MKVEDRLRQSLRDDAGRLAPSLPTAHEVARRGQRRRATLAAGMLAAAVVLVAGGAAALPALADLLRPDQEVMLDAGGEGRGYGALLAALPVDDGVDTPPLLLVGDVPLAAEAAGIDLPEAGASDWLGDAERFVEVGRHTVWPTGPGFLQAASRLEDRPFAETLGFTPTDVDQWAGWHGSSVAAMTLRLNLDDLVGFLDEADGWQPRGGDPRWYAGDGDADPALAETVDVGRADDLALVVADGLVQLGADPDADTAHRSAPPTALAEDPQPVGALPGMDSLAEVLDGWATFALIAPEPHLGTLLGRVRPAGEPLAPYRHLALAGVTDGDGDRAAVVLVHDDPADAQANAERLARNYAASDHVLHPDDVDVTRDGEVVVVDDVAPAASNAIAAVLRLELDLLAPAVPADVAND